MTRTELQQLTDTDHCPACNNVGMIDCPAHLAEVDEDGWCTTCDSPDRSKVMCDCQDE